MGNGSVATDRGTSNLTAGCVEAECSPGKEIARDRPYSATYTWYVVGLLFVVNIFNYMDRMALSVLAPAIKSDLGLTDGQIGVLTGFAFALFYAACGIPLARWADKGVRKTIIALSLAVWSLFTAFSGAAHNFWQLLLCRVGVGAGEAGGLPPAQSIICDYIPVVQRTFVFSIHTFGLTAGMTLGMIIAGMLGNSVGWRLTFVILGIPGIVIAAVVYLTLREPPRGYFEAANNVAASSLKSTIATLWRCRTYRFLIFYSVANGFSSSGLTQWWPSLYVRVYELDLATTGLYLGIALGVGSGIGLFTGGLLSNILMKRNTSLPLLVGAGSMLFAAIAALGTLFFPTSSGSIWCVFFVAVLSYVGSAPVIASLYSVVTSQMRATGGALNIFFQSVIGFSLGPLAVGLLSDRLMSSVGEESLRYALLASVVIMPIMALLLVAAARALPADLRAIGAKE